MNNRLNDSPQVGDDQGNNAEKPLPGWLKAIALPIAAIVYLFREPAVQLKRLVYDGRTGGLWQILGIIVALAAGIGLGYQLGWQHDVSTVKWVISSVAATLATYFYIWPAAVHVLLKRLFTVSEKLWSYVESDPGAYRRGKTKTNPVWFTHVLFFLVGAAIVLGAINLGWTVLTVIHAKMAMGFFGYIVGGVAGLILGVIVGSGSFALLHSVKLPFAAALIGAGTIYLARGLTQTYLPTSAFGFDFTGVVYAIEGALWMAYIFPLAHITISRGFSFVWDLVDDLCKAIYNEEKGGYREFSLQVTNVGVTYAAFQLVAGYAPTLGFGALAVYSAASLAALVAYIIVGKVLTEIGNGIVGFAASAGAAYLTFGYASTYGGLVVGLLGGALAAALTGFLLFPAAYWLVRLVAKPLLSSWLRNPLVTIHKVLSDELLHAFDRTYSDPNKNYVSLFSQLASLTATVAAYFGAVLLAGVLELGTILTFGLVGVLVLAAYLTFGKLARRYGNGLVAALLSIGAAVFVGAHVYALPDYGTLWYAIPAGIAAIVGTVFVAFPVAYVIAKALLTGIKADVWLKAIVVGAFDTVESVFSTIWQAIVENYKAIKATIDPLFTDFNRAFKQAWEQITGGKKGN